MVESLKKIYALFPKKDRIIFLLLFLMMIFASFLEVLGIGMIPAFVLTIAEPDKVLELKYIGPLLESWNITTSQDLALFGALALIVVYLIKNLYLFFFKYIKTRFVANKKIYLQSRVFKAYMAAPYTFFLNRNSAILLRNVNSEVGKVINGTIMPILQLFLQGIMFILIISGLFYLEPLITLITLIMMGGGGYIFLRYTQKKTLESGRISRDSGGAMNRVILQAIGGFKDARVLNRENLFLKQYKRFAEKQADASVYQSIIKSLPKPIIEFLMVTGILTITLIMVFQGRAFTEIIPILALFGVAAAKLMPIFNNVIQQISTINYSAYSVHAIFEDLELLENKYKDYRNLILSNANRLEFNNIIELDSVSYKYPESNDYAVKNISLVIPKGNAVAFVGPSGAGKTTLVDLILGLLTPTSGKILADGNDINKNIRGWMKNIGYIQQSSFLMDERIFRNIAFGVPDEEVDFDKLASAISAAQLEDTIDKLPNGLRSTTGERGLRLSGGQQQRVSIARALYNNPQLLIMDEATSALDNITEKYVIEAIEQLRGDRTIIMIAHRLTTVKNCDKIYMIDDGHIVGEGTYNELLESNKEFQRMSMIIDS